MNLLRQMLMKPLNTLMKIQKKKPAFLETAEPFYPLKETVEDIQTQLDDLRTRVIEYETRVSTPSFNTDVLKMIKVPQLNMRLI